MCRLSNIFQTNPWDSSRCTQIMPMGWCEIITFTYAKYEQYRVVIFIVIVIIKP